MRARFVAELQESRKVYGRYMGLKGVLTRIHTLVSMYVLTPMVLVRYMATGV